MLMLWLVLTIAIMNGLDCIFTLQAVNLFGIEVEANFLMRELIDYSPTLFFVFKMVFISVFLMILGQRTNLLKARAGVIVLFLAYSSVMFLHFKWIWMVKYVWKM